ncbi:MAG: hypothetical protein IKX94_09725 [Muribaculaceae bacterium]|nr:hypothetical protein [Muribaculaceae bacterium]MBR5745580.1 hypothetical protein [Muribaculaceae bacterium]
MKRIIRIVAIAAALICSASVYADDVTTVYIRTQSGDVGIALSELTEVTFPADGQMSVVTKNGTETYSTSNGLISLRFDQNYSGIDAVQAKELSGLQLKGRTLYSTENGIEVYSLDGVLRAKGKSNVLDVSELVRGVYVARSGSQTSKIVLR